MLGGLPNKMHETSRGSADAECRLSEVKVNVYCDFHSARSIWFLCFSFTNSDLSICLYRKTVISSLTLLSL